MSKADLKKVFKQTGATALVGATLFTAGCGGATTTTTSEDKKTDTPSTTQKLQKDQQDTAQKELDAAIEKVDEALKAPYGAKHSTTSGDQYEALVIDEMLHNAKASANNDETLKLLEKLAGRVEVVSTSIAQKEALYVKEHNGQLPNMSKLMENEAAEEAKALRKIDVVKLEDLKPVTMTEAEFLQASKADKTLEAFSVKDGNNYRVYVNAQKLYRAYPADESGSGKVFKQKLIDLIDVMEKHGAYDNNKVSALRPREQTAVLPNGTKVCFDGAVKKDAARVLGVG